MQSVNCCFSNQSFWLKKNMLIGINTACKITKCYICNLFLLNELLVSYLLIYLQIVRVKKQLM